MNVTDLVGAVRRTVKTVERDGRQARVVVAERAYPTNADDLWEALTDPERIPRWFLPVSGDLKPGGRYKLERNAEGEILACDPPRQFTITWEYGGDVSWVTVSLEALGESETRLTLEHVAHVPEEFWTQYGPGATGVGWDLGLMGLAHYLETGESRVSTPDAENEWAASPEGRQFITNASKGWADAAIADGDDPDQARKAEAGTTAFYTGEDSPS